MFCLLVRTRLSERPSRGPVLTLSQILFPICSIGWSHAITGPARGAVGSIMVMTIVLGNFALRQKMAPRLEWLAVEPLRGALARAGFDAISASLAITFSAGLAQMCAGEPQDAAIDQGDQAPSQAKKPGRNRVETG